MDILAALAIIALCYFTMKAQWGKQYDRVWNNLKAQQQTIQTLTRENAALHRENVLLRQGKNIPGGPAPRIEPQPYEVGLRH